MLNLGLIRLSLLRPSGHDCGSLMEAVFSALHSSVLPAVSLHCILAAESTLHAATESIFASALVKKLCISWDEHSGSQGALHGHLDLPHDRWKCFLRCGLTSGCCLQGAQYRDRLKYQDTQPVKKKGFLTSDFSKRDEFSMTFRTEQYRTLLQQVSVSCSLCFSAAFAYVCRCGSRADEI